MCWVPLHGDVHLLKSRRYRLGIESDKSGAEGRNPRTERQSRKFLLPGHGRYRERGDGGERRKGERRTLSFSPAASVVGFYVGFVSAWAPSLIHAFLRPARSAYSGQSQLVVRQKQS